MKGLAVLRTLVGLFSAALLLGAAPLENILSSDQQQSFMLKRQQASSESDYLKRSWISPLILQGNYQQGTSRFSTVSRDQSSLSAALRLEQDIFRSGGILAAYRYAGALGQANDWQIQAQLQGKLTEAYTALFAIRRLEVQIKKQRLLVQNADIDIRRKEEQYDQGLIDSSVLHTALLDRNAQAAALLELRQSLEQSQSAFSELSDRPADAVSLPRLEVLPLEHFLAEAPTLQAAKLQQKAAQENRTMIAAKYRPRISVGASYQHYFEDETTPASPLSSDREGVSSWGVTLTVPLDLKGPHESQSVRLQAKVAAYEYRLQRQAQRRYYEQLLARLKHLDRQIALAREDIRLHAALLDRTRDRVQAGSKTSDDQAVMANAKAARELDLELYELSRQEELLKAYAAEQEEE